jgi:heterodisulfide reductase subunit A
MKTDTELPAGKRILLVDDERVVRESVKDFLRKEKFIVVEANNGAEAFTLFTQSKFDLVMTDGTMPFLNGDELACRIRQLAPQQPILMLTGYDYKCGVRNPVNAVLQKPFDFLHLHDAIFKLL